MERPDFIFSYWIFAWYLLYYFTPFPVYNPKFAIILGLIENAIVVFLMFYYKTNPRLILLFVIMVFLLKIIPLYTILNLKIERKDVLATFGLFGVYLLWTFLNKKTIYDFIRGTKDLIIHNKNTLPGMIYLSSLGF
jgi:hypothetical protein